MTQPLSWTSHWARSQGPEKDIGIWGPGWGGGGQSLEGPFQVILSSHSAVKVPGIDSCAYHVPVKKWHPDPQSKQCHFMSLFSMLLLFLTFQKDQIIYVGRFLLTPKTLSLLFDPQDAFLSWAHSYAAFHSWSNCQVCGALLSSLAEGFPWWVSPLQVKDFLQVCNYLH